MSRISTALALITLVAGCDSANPFQNPTANAPGNAPVINPGGEVTTTGIPADLANDLRSVAYNPATGTLSVDMAALDRSDTDIPLSAYTPNPALETPAMTAQGYRVFSYQDDALDRMFVAIVAQSNDGSVVGAAVMDGGQFTRFFSGGFYATDGEYTPGNPVNDTGLVSYAGLYTGLSNLDSDDAGLLPLPAGTSTAIRPSQPSQITGSIFVNADFQDNTINGAIYDRSFVNLNPGLLASLGTSALGDVFLIPTAITDAGTFFGTAENRAQETIGSFGGTFGGLEAAGVAGTTALDGDWIPNIENEVEFGVFVLTQCGQPAEDPICGTIPVNP